MSYFKAKMYQIQFRLGLCPRLHGEAYCAPPDPLARLKEPSSKGMGERSLRPPSWIKGAYF